MGNKGAKKKQTKKELTAEDIADLEELTKFTESDIREWYDGFSRDCYPYDYLDRPNFLRIFKRFYLNDERAEIFCDYIFRTLDKDPEDPNSKINFHEFLVAIASTSQGSLKERLGLAFDMYDVSKNGNLDENELAFLIQAMYNVVGETDRKGERDPKTYAKAIIEKLDTDGDGKLSREEFILACNLDKRLKKALAPYA